jgi:hypothetical protein
VTPFGPFRRLSFFPFSLSANIPEVCKTRLQLQGELSKIKDAPKVYNNIFDVVRKTWRNEGIKGLQRGLGTAVSSPIASVTSVVEKKLIYLFLVWF